jgi:RHS repeat-associated protein
MKKIFPFLFLMLCINAIASAQGLDYGDGLNFRSDYAVLNLKPADIITFVKKDTTAFITKCFLDTVHKKIHYFHCYGGRFYTLDIAPEDMHAVLANKATPFEYFNLVLMDFEDGIQKAKKNLQDNGSNAKFTEEENEFLENIGDSVKFPSTLSKLLNLDKQLVEAETYFTQFNSLQPRYITRDRLYYNTFDNEYGHMVVWRESDSIATFYNKIDAQPVYKAVLDLRKATIDYYNRSNEIVDEIEINKDKVILLATEKFDVFALYRTWLEWKRQNIVDAITQTKKQANVSAIKKYAINELAYQTQSLSAINYKIDYFTNADKQYLLQRLRRKFGRIFAPFDPWETSRMMHNTKGDKSYELRDQRGNVMVVISDMKRGVPRKDNPDLVDHYEAIVLSATDYTSFGKPMEGRSFNSGSYPYGFNDKRNDPETGYQDYGMRIYDPQIARFLSVDPLKDKFAFYSPYQFAGNNPIKFIDLDGLEPTVPGNKVGETQTGTNDNNDIASTWTWTGKSWQEATLSPVEVTAKRDNSRAAFNNAFAFNYTQADAQKFIDQRATAFHRLNTKQPLVQQGDDPEYIYLSGNYKREYEADQSYRNMQLGAVAILFAPIVLPEVATAGTGYISSALTASTGARVGAAGINAGFQYIQNAPQYGWWGDNFKNINLTSVGLSFLNPTSTAIAANAIVGNFGRGTISTGFNESFLGSRFNFNSAAAGTILDFGGAKLGSGLEKLSIKFGNFNPTQGKVFGDILGNTVATPANIIKDQSLNKDN